MLGNSELSSIIKIIKYLPIEDSIKFIYRLFELDNLELTLDLSLKDYRNKLIKNLYPKNFIQNFNPKTLELIDVLISEEHSMLHVITDNTNNIIHINSESKRLLNQSVKNLILNGYIIKPANIKKNSKIFNLKFYKCYYLGPKLLPICLN